MILMKKVCYSHLMRPCHMQHFIMTDSSRPVGWRKQEITLDIKYLTRRHPGLGNMENILAQ